MVTNCTNAVTYTISKQYLGGNRVSYGRCEKGKNVLAEIARHVEIRTAVDEISCLFIVGGLCDGGDPRVTEVVAQGCHREAYPMEDTEALPVQHDAKQDVDELDKYMSDDVHRKWAFTL